MKKYSLDEINSDEQLLEKIKRVDGSGSGLDADKLDGLEASNFANMQGDNTQTFKVAPAVNDDEALSKGQLLDAIKEVDGAGSGLDADLVRGLPADFTNSLSENGYQILPSGLIIQWVTSTTDGDGVFTATFPIAFPNEGLAGFSTVRGDNYTAQNGKPSTTKISGSTLNVDVNGSSGKTVNSLAIGY